MQYVDTKKILEVCRMCNRATITSTKVTSLEDQVTATEQHFTAF